MYKILQAWNSGLIIPDIAVLYGMSANEITVTIGGMMSTTLADVC